MAPTPTPRSLADLVAETEGASLMSGDAETPIGGVTHDTRRLAPGDLFVAVPGLQHDGLEFVPHALANGAAAIAAERAPQSRSGVPWVLVENARGALAELSAAFYGHPSRHLPVIGVTGTDGKTSTTHLLSAILEARGLRTGWLTTVNTKIGNLVRPNAADHTTPEAPLVQRTLAEMLACGVDVAILETSSHALQLDRVHGVSYRVGVFTNLSPEHINFHGSFEAYLAAKRRLFERLPADGLAVLNADDPSSEAMRLATRARVVSYGLDDPDALINARDIRLSPGGTTFTLRAPTSPPAPTSPAASSAATTPSAAPSPLDPSAASPAGEVVVRTRLVGRFNVSNWLAAYAAATFFGATPKDLVLAAAAQPPVGGRMNLVDRGQPYAVIVDFAHTPQALGKALDTVRSLLGPAGHVFLAFGLAGGRDIANRPVMGELAAQKTDFFAITLDDPYDEDPAAIADQIASGATAAGARTGRDFTIELDRRAAIRLLLERASPGDAVLLAGKGHEERMVVGAERRPWNDAVAADELLLELGHAGRAVP